MRSARTRRNFQLLSGAIKSNGTHTIRTIDYFLLTLRLLEFFLGRRYVSYEYFYCLLQIVLKLSGFSVDKRISERLKTRGITIDPERKYFICEQAYYIDKPIYNSAQRPSACNERDKLHRIQIDWTILRAIMKLRIISFWESTDRHWTNDCILKVSREFPRLATLFHHERVYFFIRTIFY